MKLNFIFPLFFLTIGLQAQVLIHGKIIAGNGEPVSGANVFIEGSYDGCTTDSTGNFSFSTTLKGQQQLTVSFVGYEPQFILTDPGKNILPLTIKLKESVSELDEVVINAGTFEASDQKKSVILRPIDIATTPSANGDIYGALATMPGAQKAGEEGRLFVRGGESYETKTFMDGMLVNTPYFSNMPDLPTRGRFSPLLFNGTVFSTGGYSAEFGQALSSIVALNTTALEPENKSGISIISVGVQASHAKRWDNTSLAVSGEFLHSGLSNKIFKQDIDWINQPVISGSTVMFRHKTSETGMIKTFCSFNYNASSMWYNNFQESSVQAISLKNNTAYFNATYAEMLGKKWMANTGIAWNMDFEKTGMDSDEINTVKKSGQAKAVFTNFFSDKIELKIGGDFTFNDYFQKIEMGGHFELPFSNQQFSVFCESEMKLSKYFAVRLGGRAEYSSLLNKSGIMPRISSALKTGKYSQVSMAFGTFYQNPEDDYLKFVASLEPEKSTHSILTFQYKKDTRTFRVEAYYKKYTNLVKYLEEYSVDPNNYFNAGSGFSKGIDIFWRDQKPIDKSDYWISYSWNDTRRNYRDFPVQAAPYYASAHNFSAVYKRFFRSVNVYSGITYSFASGRPYFNPNNPVFMADRTKPYQDISLNLTHITKIFSKQAVVHLVLNNLLGFSNIFGYTYRNTSDASGFYASAPVKPPAKRMAILLVSLSL